MTSCESYAFGHVFCPLPSPLCVGLYRRPIYVCVGERARGYSVADPGILEGGRRSQGPPKAMSVRMFKLTSKKPHKLDIPPPPPIRHWCSTCLESLDEFLAGEAHALVLVQRLEEVHKSKVLLGHEYEQDLKRILVAVKWLLDLVKVFDNLLYKASIKK